MIKLLQGNNLDLLNDFIENGTTVDKIITSPPYNIMRKGHDRGYDEYKDYDHSNDEYLDYLKTLLLKIDKVLNKNGAILWNMSYGSENTELLFLFLGMVIKETPFTINEIVYWKKNSAIPNNVSHNKLTRIVEPIFVISRKSEAKTFTTNKEIIGQRKTGQNIYANMFNFFEAKNNNGSTSLNKATFSQEMVGEIIDRYVKKDDIVLDVFSGTGTTVAECKVREIQAYGFELSQAQHEYAVNRVNKIDNTQLSLFNK